MYNALIYFDTFMSSLPLELERLIFETAALQDIDHDSRVQLILVAKRVYEWIRPILYRIAIAHWTPQLQGIQPIRSWKNAQINSVAPFVRHLLVTSTKFIDLLSTFHNTENLAIWLGPEITPKALKMMNDLPLRMLSVGLTDISLDEAIMYCPAFMNITHLEVVTLEASTWSDCKALVEFQNLTHLSIDTNGVALGAIVMDLLEHCPSLRVMIYQLFPGYGHIVESRDPRFLVLLDLMCLEESIEEWEMSANGRIGLWELSEIIIEARKDKLFKDNSACIFSRSSWMDALNEDGAQWYNEWIKV